MVDFTDYSVSGPITRPWYVVEMQLGQETVRFSTGDAADWDEAEFPSGLTAKENGFEVDDDSLRIQLINTDFKYSAAALRGDFHGGEISAWYAPRDARFMRTVLASPGYVEPGYEEAPEDITPTLVFSGKISEITQIGKTIGISALRRKLGGFPSVRIVPPFANHTAAPGTKITFNNTIYLVEKR